MGTTPLRQFLQSLCCNYSWNYAVFWKLQHHSQMLLTWEDGYCSIPEQRESMESRLDDIFFKGSDEVFSANGEPSTCDGNSGGYPLELAVACMSSVQYALGDGVVGEVAYTGNYRWVFSDNISAGEYESKLLPECPDEWLFQFAAGIKTLLLVPVIPHGVLQLGSMEMVAEDLQLVAYIIDKIFSHHNFVGFSVPPHGKGEFLPQTSLSLMSAHMGNLNELSALTINEIKSEDLKAVDSDRPAQQTKSTINKITPPCKNSSHISEEDMLSNLTSVQLMGSIEIPEPLYHPLNCNKLEMMESNSMFQPSLEEDLHYSDGCDMGVFREHADKTTNSYSVGMMEQLFIDQDTNNTGDKDVSSFFSFPRDCELHRALGPAFMGHTNNIRSSMTPSRQFSASSEGHNQPETNAVTGEDNVPRSCVNSAFVDRGSNGVSNSSSPSASPFENVMSALIEEQQQKKGCGYVHPRMGSKLSSASKRRARLGDNQRPRPRDRQLIQDKVKELRELVPDGAKCSIDGLLYRTINHMLFLRNVTDQADKLRQSINHKVLGRKNLKPSETKAGSQTGTSWAFEFGSEEQICPIVVEDLEYPGHMLIEMLCNDHVHFLEIAEVIHRLDLTILKGVMESHSDKTWAHFIIEAPQGRRLDIFWPLMQLMQQKRKPISSKI